MILYFAGNTTNRFLENDLVVTCGIQHRLLSFADAFGWATAAFEYWASDDAPRPFFLDSGAFGALTRGATINLDHYCQWIKDHQQHLACYACLDVIGNWRASARNYDRMLAKGLNPIPTYHMGSPEHELRRLLGMADYIALGGVVGAHENDMKPWLDRCFNIIYHEFWPKKVHVFGVLAQWALERYPLYSADGSSALVGAGMGRVTTFEEGRMYARPWMEYAKQTHDGHVMDFISTVQAKKGSAHRGRRRVNAQAFHDLQRHVTDLWTMRGILWEDPPCAASMVPSAPTSTATFSTDSE